MTETPWSHLIDVPTVVELHDELIRQFGGRESGDTAGCVDGALGAAWNAVSYQDVDAQDVLVFAGYALFYLATKNCFTDGNKRTALATALEILASVSLRVEATEDDQVNYMLDVASGKVESAGAVVLWLAPRLAELQATA